MLVLVTALSWRLASCMTTAWMSVQAVYVLLMVAGALSSRLDDKSVLHPGIGLSSYTTAR